MYHDPLRKASLPGRRPPPTGAVCPTVPGPTDPPGSSPTGLPGGTTGEAGEGPVSTAILGEAREGRSPRATLGQGAAEAELPPAGIMPRFALMSTAKPAPPPANQGDG
jgi:hypothetical protein